MVVASVTIWLRRVGARLRIWSQRGSTVLRESSRQRVGLVAAGIAATLAVVLVVTMMGGSDGDNGTAVAAGSEKQAAAATIDIAPEHDSDDVRPDKPIKVTAAGGTLTDVTVQGKGDPVTGSYSDDKRGWKSSGTLEPRRTYTVTATAKNPDGKVTTTTSRFKTLTPRNGVEIIDVTPMKGETVGVGMPIIVTFSGPVHNKDKVERALEVTSEHDDAGAWRWLSDQQVAFRTEEYWEPNQRVTFKGHLSGVRAAKDTYGTEDFSRKFKIGDSHISTINVKKHTMTVKENGETERRFGISAGKATTYAYTTASGVHLTMDKGNPVRMKSPPHIKKGDPEYYDLDVYWAVRISNSGEYVHAMASTTWAQGRQNVSHGCVNASPENGEWFYKYSYRGDPVKVTGTSRDLEWNNGYGYWQMSFKKWKKGSALD
ncbi:MAG: L,D-transpeptidase family protein [Streptosporangiales bacterium]|nr:L,D-transpeptidase family protein [Streptosporangiales bacterium]